MTFRVVPDTYERCRWAIRFGVTLHTRCKREAGHGVDNHGDQLAHKGRGLEEFSYQRVEWFPGDRREYETDRSDDFAWEQPETGEPR